MSTTDPDSRDTAIASVLAQANSDCAINNAKNLSEAQAAFANWVKSIQDGSPKNTPQPIVPPKWIVVLVNAPGNPFDGFSAAMPGSDPITTFLVPTGLLDPPIVYPSGQIDIGNLVWRDPATGNKFFACLQPPRGNDTFATTGTAGQDTPPFVSAPDGTLGPFTVVGTGAGYFYAKFATAPAA